MARMMPRAHSLLVLTAACTAAAASAGDVPGNLAPLATVTATSEYSDRYTAARVADGVIPARGARDDAGGAWCVNGATHRDGAELVFAWPAPQTVAEIVYYGRTGWLPDENWRACRVFADDATNALAAAELKPGHGPQRIRLPAPATARRLRLVFRGSYGGPNPGASEIRIFGTPAPDTLLGRFEPCEPDGGPPRTPPVPLSDALAQKLRGGALGFRELVAVRRHAVKPSHVYTYHQEGLAPGGGLCVVAPDAPEAAPRELVASPQGVILDVDLSFDGREVLFSWKRTMAEPFQLFVVGIDGTGLRRITDHDSNNFNASWLPGGDIVFLSDRKPAYAYCWVTSTPILYRCDRDGGGLTRLSANYLNDFTPSVMADGRILYSRWEYVDRPAIPIQSLWSIRPDGTGLAGVFGNRVLSPATFMEAFDVPGAAGRILCVMTAHNGPCRGALGLIDPSRGANAQAAIRNLTPEVDIGRVGEGSGNHVRGPYESPYPLDAEHFLCSNGGTLELRDFAGTGRAVVRAPDGGPGWFQARPVRPRPEPPAVARPAPAEAPEGWATLLVQDVYAGLEPAVARGEIAEIAVVQEVEKSRRADVNRRAFGFQFPVVSCGATYAPKKVWGFAHVEADGSAHFRAPAGLPVYFMALDRHGRALQRMRTFTHLMPGESQSCIGCHADRNAATHPPAGSRLPLAARRAAEALREPEWGLRGFDYATIVQPVLDRHCAGCHGPVARAGGLDLSADRTDFFCVSYEHLARKGTGAERWEVGGHAPRSMGASRYTSWIPTYNGMESDILEIAPRRWGSPASRLADLVLAGHPDDGGRPRVALAGAEQRRILAWIDLNVPYYGTSESRHPDLPGCRRVVPERLDAVLADVAARRCTPCHEGGRIPRGFFTRITNPENNAFLLAPLARDAGGAEACGRAVFASRDDPDYRAILDTFGPVTDLLAREPREDLPAPARLSSSRDRR